MTILIVIFMIICLPLPLESVECEGWGDWQIPQYDIPVQKI